MSEQSTTSLLLDYRALKSEAHDELSDLYDHELSIGVNLLLLLSESIRFANRRLFEPIAATYLMLPSALCDTLPYLACIGEAGSGKSTIGFIASGLWGTQPLQGNSTFASLRNWVSKNSFYDTGNQQLANCMLVWDDITGYFLKDIKMYSFLKSGYSIKSSICTIALEKGDILQFHTFCPKVLSSIDKFYLRSEFTEITRRLLIIPTQKLDKMTDSSLSQYSDMDDTNGLLNLKSCDLTQYKNGLFSSWQDLTKVKTFNQLTKDLTGRKKPIKTSRKIGSAEYELMPNLIACGYVQGIWELQEGYDLLEDYFVYKNEVILKNKSALSEHLAQFVLVRTYLSEDKKIIPQTLKDDLNIQLKIGALDKYPSIETINTEMFNLGYSLQKVGTETYWLPFN